jgi:hypothetical protein
MKIRYSRNSEPEQLYRILQVNLLSVRLENCETFEEIIVGRDEVQERLIKINIPPYDCFVIHHDPSYKRRAEEHSTEEEEEEEQEEQPCAMTLAKGRREEEIIREIEEKEK